MDVAAAFPSVARGCLLRKMRNTGIDKCLVRWTGSFMEDRRVIMSVDGQDGKEMAVTTGLPQGSPVSPVLFSLYIADIHKAVEGQVEDCRGISFVDDVTWIVEGYDISEVASKLEKCAAASLRWAEDNAVRFETSKTEAILFSRKRKHRQCQRGIRVGDQMVRFAPGATRWLGIWLDSALTLQENRRRRIGKTRQAKAKIRRIINQYGVPPGSARALSMSLVQGTMLYAAEPTWNGQKGVEGEYQRAINRMARSTLGVFRSTLQGILAAESGHTPARALLDYRQSRFVQLHARPLRGGGPEEILECDDGAMVRKLRAAANTRQGETVEPQVWSESKTFPGLCEIAPEAQALETAREWRAQGTIWTDVSRVDDGKVGAACAWQTEDGWTGRLFHLGNNKEVFDAEIFAIYQALKVFEAREQAGRKYAVFSDSQAAIRRAATDSMGPGQQWARAIIEVADRVMARGNEISIIWIPAHQGVPGNEVVDGMAKTAAGDTSYEVPDQVRWQTSLPHLARRATERRAQATTQWVRDHVRPERRYHPPGGSGL